jgi:hypothetical protein
MDLLYSVFFGAGVAAFVYSKMGRRVGYGNTQSQWFLVGSIFVIAAVFFYTLLAFVLKVR